MTGPGEARGTRNEATSGAPEGGWTSSDDGFRPGDSTLSGTVYAAVVDAWVFLLAWEVPCTPEANRNLRTYFMGV